MTIYLCEPDFDGILSAVYEAWTSGKGHENVKLELDGAFRELELFTQYVTVRTSPENARKVIRAVCGKIGRAVYEEIYIASLSQDPARPDKIYRFLIRAFRRGAGVLDMLQLPEVREIFQMCRNVRHENHLLTGFVRFSQTSKGILVSRIGPKNDVLPILAPHFADRLPMESWIIYDENHRKAVVHPSRGSWAIVHADGEGYLSAQLDQDTDQEEYEALWKAFHETVAIRERANPICQRTHLALRYRPYMTEFQ